MKIKEVSELYHMTPDTLRYYERIGLIRNVHRDKNGIRDYSQANCDSIAFIKCMRNAGVSIEGLQQYTDLYEQGDETQQDRLNILLKEREKLATRFDRMQKALERLDYKIDLHRHKIDGKE